MANYFNYFPKVVYNLGNKDTLDTVINLSTNYSFIGDLLNNTSVFYEYNITDGDTPEIVSYKVYGDSFYHWLILKMNNILDVKKDWPLDYKSLVDNIESNYLQYASVGQTGLEWALSNYHSYYRVETKTYIGSIEQQVEKYQIDSTTYASLTPSTTQITLPSNIIMNLAISKDRKTYYDYEIETNDLKRNIKILKSEFLNPIKDEFVRIMTNE